eukprot:11846011-Alexandrium_andersonii.AAC.1
MSRWAGGHWTHGCTDAWRDEQAGGRVDGLHSPRPESRKSPSRLASPTTSIIELVTASLGRSRCVALPWPTPSVASSSASCTRSGSPPARS